MKAVWRGSIGFGLVNIPVNLYPASRERALNFDYLRKSDFCPIGYVKVCKRTGEEVPYHSIVRGYEYQKGEYAILEEADFKRASVKKTELIEIMDFVDEKEIDSKYFIRPYYVEPEKSASKAYVLLRKALEKSGKVAVAKFVMRAREYLAVIKPEDKALVLVEMRFHSEIAPDIELNIPKDATVDAKELDIALKLVEELSLPFDPKIYKDTYTDELKKIIRMKAKGKLTHVKKAEAIEPTQTQDLMEKLKASVDKDYIKRAKYAHAG